MSAVLPESRARLHRRSGYHTRILAEFRRYRRSRLRFHPSARTWRQTLLRLEIGGDLGRYELLSHARPDPSSLLMRLAEDTDSSLFAQFQALPSFPSVFSDVGLNPDKVSDLARDVSLEGKATTDSKNANHPCGSSAVLR